MSRARIVVSSLAVLGAVAIAAAPARAQQLKLVNVTPAAAGGEARQDAQPVVAVNPRNPELIVVAALTGPLGGAALAPLYVSRDGGSSWSASALLPSQAGAAFGVHDVALRWNGAGDALYAAIVRSAPGGAGDFELQVLRTTDASLTAPMAVIARRVGPERPRLAVATATGWLDAGKDRVYLGLGQGASPLAEVALDAAAAAPVFSPVALEQGAAPGTLGGLQTAVAVHPAGVVYAAFYRRTAACTAAGIGAVCPAEVVVVRDDDWGRGAPPTPPFRALLDAASHRVGQRAVSGLALPLGLAPELGQERVAGDLALAVDPTDRRAVYLGYVDRQGGDLATLHVRASTDGGQSFGGADLIVVHNARAAGLAVSGHGRLGLAYQQLVAAPAPRWQTHFRRWDGAAWDDTLLSSTDAQRPAAVGSPYLGEGFSLTAAGRDFHGAFAAANLPDPAAFAPGVAWQRAVDGGKLRAGGAEVPTSIDPFYFRVRELGPEADFFVRDWTESAAVHDAGQEPSGRAAFFESGDVWNRRSDDPGAFDGSDRPASEEPRGLGAAGDHAFVRVGRAIAGPAATVQVDFAVADAGIGTNFLPLARAQLAFAAADTQKTLAAGQGVAWEPPAGASHHVALAAAISAAGDPENGAPLFGHAAGWPNPDLSLPEDNNRAMRSARVVLGPAGGALGAYVVAHNAALVTRDLVVGVEVPREAQKVALRVIGGEGRREGPGLLLPAMAPGENRWIEVTWTAGPDKPGHAPTLRLYELWAGRRLGGHALELRTGSAAAVAGEGAVEQAAVLTRLGGTTGIATCAEPGKAAAAVVASKELEKAPAGFGAFVKKQAAGLADCAAALVQLSGGKDPFQLGAAARALRAGGEGARLAAAHAVLLARLDAHESWRQKAAGDPADAVQMVLWQGELHGERLALRQVPGAAALVADGQAFVRAFETRKAGLDDYAKLVKRSLNLFRATAQRLPGAGLDASVAAMEGLLGSPAALERAHRDYLLRLSSATAP